MKMVIVGVGQTFNFETRSMEDVLQVQTPVGVINVPTTNEGAQALVQIAMGEDEPQRVMMEMPSSDNSLAQQLHQAYRQPSGAEQPSTVEYPEGASVFGGAASEEFEEMLRQSGPDTGDPTHGNPDGPSVLVGGQQLFRQVMDTHIGRAKGVNAKMGDRSGIPSKTLSTSQVDEAGNPIVSNAPQMDDDEDDPGEQI